MRDDRYSCGRCGCGVNTEYRIARFLRLGTRINSTKEGIQARLANRLERHDSIGSVGYPTMHMLILAVRQR